MKTATVIALPASRGVIEALAEASGGHDGWWQASGFVEDVELRVASEGGSDAPRMLRGRYSVTLVGPSGGPYMVQLARAARSGLGSTYEFAAGQLVAARTAKVTAFFVPAEVHGQAGSVPKSEQARGSSPSASGAPFTSMFAAQAAAVASSRPAEQEEPEQVIPELGDLVHHFAFGWCEVVQSDGDRLKLRDVQNQGRVREIMTDRLEIEGPSDKDGKRAFKLTRRV